MKMKLKSILASALCAVGLAAFAAEPDAVQLWKGGPIWAEVNLGATTPEDYGILTNFNDAAQAVTDALGSDWHLPSDGELKMLAGNNDGDKVCSNVWTTCNGVAGCRFFGMTSGYEDKSIFLPAAGYDKGMGHKNAGVEGVYWSSTEMGDYGAYDLDFIEGSVGFPSSARRYGFSVRAVRDVVEYLDWDDVEKKMTNAVCEVYEVVTNEMATFEAGKTYVVKGNVTNTTGIVVNGTPSNPTRLILCDGAELEVKCWDSTPGLTVTADKALVICGQVGGTGKLTATGGMWCAGIGSSDSGKGGTVTINGGTVTATGGQFGAGIGGGQGAAGGTVTINGGTVTATGDVDAAGIGKGDGGNPGTVNFGTMFSVLAGDDAASAQPVPQDDYVNDHSARYVHIAPPPPPEVSAESDEFTVDLRTSVNLAKGEVTVSNVTWSATQWGALKYETFTTVGWTNLLTGATGVFGNLSNIMGEGKKDADLPKVDGDYVLTHSTGDLTSFVTFTVSGYPAGSSPENPWYVGTPDKDGVTAWVDNALTNVAPIVADIGLPDATNVLDLVALTNGMAKSGYVPLLPLNAILLTGSGAGVLPAHWMNQNGKTFATLAEALAAGSTTVTPVFETDDGKVDPPKAIVEEVEVEGVKKIVTATMRNNPGSVSGAIQAIGVGCLADLAEEIKTNVELVVTAKNSVESSGKLLKAATEALGGRETKSTTPHYVDLALSAVAEDGTKTELYELAEGQELIIAIPWTFEAHHDYVVVRCHNDVAEVFEESTRIEDGAVEFDKEAGLINVSSRFFSDYAVVDFELSTVLIKVPATLPEGVESITVTTNGVPVAPKTAGVVSTYEIDVGVPVEVVATAKSGYGFKSEGGASTKTLASGTPGDDVTVDVGDLATEPTLGASLLYPVGDGAFKPAEKSTTYYGTLIGTNGVEGTITLKMTKPNKRTGQFNLSATVKTLVDKQSYSFKASKVTEEDGDAADDGALTFVLLGSNKRAREHELAVTLGGDSLTGAFDGFLIDGARHVFSTRGDSKREEITSFVGTWTGAFAHSPATVESVTNLLGATFSAKLTKSGSTKIKVYFANGKTASCSAKAEVGADIVAVPVTLWRSVKGGKRSLGFRLVFAVNADGKAVCEAADLTSVRDWTKKTDETVVVEELRFLAAGLQTVTAKEFKSYVVTVDPALEAQFGPVTKSTLRLTASTGLISGSLRWTVEYVDARDRERTKTVTGKAKGIIVNGIGIGTVTVKRDKVTESFDFTAVPAK